MFIQRGKVLEIFRLLGTAQGILYALKERHYYGNKDLQRRMEGDCEKGIQALHLVVEYLTPSLGPIADKLNRDLARDAEKEEVEECP